MTDQELIRRICGGETDLFKVLVEKYYPGLLRYIMVMTKDYYTADDVCQETFIKVYKKLYTYDSQYKFSAWLYQIGHNRALDLLRKKPALPLYETAPDEGGNELMLRLDKERQLTLLQRAVLTLPAHYRSVVSLYYWDGLQYQEIAAIHGVPINTVKTWLRRAKQALKEQLDDKV